MATRPSSWPGSVVQYSHVTVARATVEMFREHRRAAAVKPARDVGAPSSR